MTQPGSNDINLAALWVPVMPETSQMMPAMAKAGEKAKQEFAQGFSHAGGGAGSPEEMGRQWAGQFMKSFNSTFSGMPMPQGIRDFMGSLRRETELTESETRKLGETQKKTWQEHQQLTQRAAQLQTELTRRTLEYNQAVDKGRGNPNERAAIIKLQQQHTEVIGQATAKYGDYTSATERLSGATSTATQGSNLMAAAIGGAAGAVVTLGISAVQNLASAYLHLWETGIKLAIGGIKEFSSLVLESAESYEALNNQLDLFTTASGAELEALNQSAATVFGNMDAGGQEVGNTMAVLAQRLGMEAGPALEQLTYHVGELRGRFGQLDTENFTAGLIDFGVGGDKADASLAALTRQAQTAATPLNDLVTMMKTAGPTLDAAGLSYEQAAAFVGQMSTRGSEARQMMTGLQTAQKEFSDRGWTFAEGLKNTADQLKVYRDTGNEVAAQQLSEKLFGSRRWADALAMAESFSNVISAQPGAFSASSDSLDVLIDNTATLSEKWEEVKRKAEEALRPMGSAVLGVVGNGLEKLKTWIDGNMPKITEKIRSLGNSFIDNLPGIKQFAADLIRIMGAAADVVTMHISQIMAAVGMFMGMASMMMNLVPAPVRALIPNFNELKDSMGNVGKTTVEMAKGLGDLKLGDKANDIADWVEGLNVDVPELHDNWNGLIDDMNNNVPKGIGTALGSTLTGLPALPPGAPPGTNTGGAAPGSSGPGAPNAAPGATNPLTTPLGPGGRVPDWDATAQNESGGRWDLPYGDQDSTGGLQIQQRTWVDFGGLALAPHPYQASKADQIAIAEKILAAQGPSAWAGGKNFVWKTGYQMGGTVPHGNSVFAPNSHDTTPIWAEGGEEIINKSSSAKWRSLLKMINADEFQGGGTVYDPTGGQVNTLAVAEAVSTLFPQIKTIGIYRGPDGPNEHSSGEAADVMTADQELGTYIKNYLLGNASSFGVKYCLWQQKQWDPDGTVTPMNDRGGITQNHFDHVHVRTNGGGFPQGGGPGPKGTGTMPKGSSDVVSPIAAGMFKGGGSYTAGGGGGNGEYPGLPGQYGGYGQYGAQDYDSVERNRQAVREAHQRADDMDYDIGEKQKEIERLKAELATAKAGEQDPLYPNRKLPPDPAKAQAAQDKLDSATHDLATKVRERGDQTDEISQAEHKQAEDAMKPPKGAAQKEYQIPGASQFTQLGGGLVKGLAEGFGFGDVFDKPPWEWGIMKLLAGGLNWGLGTANAWADQIGQGKTGLTNNSGVPLPGWEQGGSMGLANLFGGFADAVGVDNLGKVTGPLGGNQGQFPNVSSGPNIDPTQGMPNPYGAYGAPPGPVVHQDNSVNVENHGPNQSDYDTWKQGANSQRAPGAMGGLPTP